MNFVLYLSRDNVANVLSNSSLSQFDIKYLTNYRKYGERGLNGEEANGFMIFVKTLTGSFIAIIYLLQLKRKRVYVFHHNTCDN